MKFTIYLGLIYLIASCTSVPRDNSRQLGATIVGQWEWKEGPENCMNFVNMAFRSDGTYTRTSESCNFADDGFANFYYGWYVADEHICFVQIDEQFEEENPRTNFYKKLFLEQKKNGFVKETCTWKIEDAKKDRIVITIKFTEDEIVRFTMVRKRWL